jgi:glycosyltransferase involved in cell wall biosynthesis
LRASWGLQADDLAVLYVGRLAAEKNVELVLTAYRAIVAKVPSAKMIFVGDGPLKPSLQQSMPQAIFCGSKTGVDLASHYASGDLFLFPSVTETYGNVTAEALASGLCVLAYDRAAAAELIRSDENGLVVTSGDAQAFTQAAVELATEPARLNSLRAQAAASILQRDWQHVYEMFIAKLNEVVQQHAQATPHALNAAAMQGAKS